MAMYDDDEDDAPIRRRKRIREQTNGPDGGPDGAPEPPLRRHIRLSEQDNGGEETPPFDGGTPPFRRHQRMKDNGADGPPEEEKGGIPSDWRAGKPRPPQQPSPDGSPEGRPPTRGLSDGIATAIRSRGPEVATLMRRRQAQVGERFRRFGSTPTGSDPDAPKPKIRARRRAFNPYGGEYS